MPTEDNPTGLAYLKTFQSLFQTVELIFLLVTWALLASQQYYMKPAYSFALGVYISVWLVTLFFFMTYITGLHTKINNKLASIGNKPSSSPSTEGTAGSLAPPPEAARFVPKGVHWFAAEYIIYFICDVFLFVAVCIVTSHANQNTHYIASYAFGWFSLLVYILHFCLLVKNTEGVWPHACISDCCRQITKRKTSSESQQLIQPEEP